MIWFALILAVIVGIITGIFTRSLRRAVIFLLGTFAFGVVLSLIILFSGILGG